jgi:hypothetical protein
MGRYRMSRYGMGWDEIGCVDIGWDRLEKMYRDGIE